MRFLLAATLSLLAGCTLYFEGDDGDDDVRPPCVTDVITERTLLVNPETLACQTFTTTRCDESCGPCAETTAQDPPLPPWGECASACLGLSEAACTSASACRVTRRADYYYANSASPDDFLGCFPLSEVVILPPVICDSLDALQCSSHPSCTAIYDAPYGVSCGGFLAPEACPGATFQGCVAEATIYPGTCHAAVACDAAPPPCPTGSEPGIRNGCFTGVRIPEAFCSDLAF